MLFRSNVTRAVSRLKTVFFSFDTVNTPSATAGTLIQKDWNNFEHPMNGTYDVTREVQYQVQIGSKLFPEYPVRSLAQAFFELKKALGIASSSFHSICPTYAQYMNRHFIVGVDTEKILEAGFTGLNTRAGDLMTIRVQGANGALGVNDLGSKIYITLHSDLILEIRDTGCQVFD